MSGVPQVIQIYDGYQLPGNRNIFSSSCMKLISPHIDLREMAAGSGRMPSHAYGENMDERVKHTRQIFLSKIPK